jgi:hypothetical protein
LNGEKQFLLFEQRDARVNSTISNNGGRRKKIERRQFSYTVHIPERRSGVDRRSPEDRRRSSRNEEDELLASRQEN